MQAGCLPAAARMVSGNQPLGRRMGPLMELFALFIFAPSDRPPPITQVPVTFIYGSNDWMDPAGARRACEGMAQRRPPSGPRDQQVITINVRLSCHSYSNLLQSWLLFQGCFTNIFHL